MSHRDVRRSLHLTSVITVVDCTLREGDQTPGVTLSRPDKLRLAEALAAAGLRHLELGMPAISSYEAETIRQIVALGLGITSFVLCLATREDILRAQALGVDGVIVSLPAGQLQIAAKLGWPEERVIDTAVELSSFAHELGLKVTVSPYDTTRADLSFLGRYACEVLKNGHADRIRLVDTVGCATPPVITLLVRRIRRWTAGRVPIEIHCHNDFGLAVANTLAGVAAGAEVVSTTMSGLGERAGGAATEQVVAALELLYGLETGVEMGHLAGLCALVAQMSGIGLQPHQPLVGPDTFLMEAGSVIAGYRKQPLVAFPFPPDLVGGQARVVLGKQSGKQSIHQKAIELGLPEPDEAVAMRLLNRIKGFSEQEAKHVPDELFVAWLLAEVAPQSQMDQDEC